MSLQIGTMLPSRALEQSEFNRALVAVAIQLGQLKSDPVQAAAPCLDITFLLPGRDEKPDFQGLRLRVFSAVSQRLRIESAVPEKMLLSTHAGDFIIAVIQDAIDGAADFFAEENVQFDAESHMALAQRLIPPDPNSDTPRSPITQP